MQPCGSHPHEIASKSTKKPRNHVKIVVFVVETKRIELSTLRMRTVRSRTRAGFSTIQTINNGLKDAGSGSFSLLLALFKRTHL